MGAVTFVILLLNLFISATSLIIRGILGEDDGNVDGSRNLRSQSAFDHFLSSNHSRRKLLFFAGVEGSGHHLMEALTKQIRFCETFSPKEQAVGRTWRCGSEWQRQDLDDFTKHLRSLQRGCINVLPQLMSYPMCGLGPPIRHEFRQKSGYPRLDWMQEAALKAGVDLHVIQLHRPLDDCLAADCMHRQFDSCSSETETLAANGAVLARHLQGLAPEQISCFRYGNPKSMEKAVRSSFGNKTKGLVSRIWKDHASSEGLRGLVHNWKKLSTKLQPVQDSLESICNASSPVTVRALSAFQL